jgi:hypothetical protein
MGWRKDRLFNKWCWEKWLSTYRRLKIDSSLSPCNSINPSWNKNLNVKSEAAKHTPE